MPVIKRYFKVSQEINHDPEMWEMTEKFGDKALRVWLQILSALDRGDNEYKLSGLWLSQLSKTTKTNMKTVLPAVLWMIERKWLIVSGDISECADWVQTSRRLAADFPQTHRRLPADSPQNPRRILADFAQTGCRLVLRAPNWTKYNRTQERKGSGQVPASLPSYPTPTPTPILTLPKKKNAPLRANFMADSEWIEELKKNPAYLHINFTVEMGKMDAWFGIPKHAKRKRTRSFVLNWINKIEPPMHPVSTRPTKVVL